MRKGIVVILVGMLLLAMMPEKINGLNQPFPVYGYITDSEGNPVAGEEVKIIDISKSTYITDITNSTGYYQVNLYDLPQCENGDTIKVYCSHGEEYNYKIFVLDVTELSKNVSFNLISPPYVEVDEVTDITSSSAKINAELIDMGGSNYCVLWVEYGATSNYGKSTASKTLYMPSTVSFTLQNLEPDKTYHYRIVAQNSRKIFYSGDSTFKTNASLPSVLTMDASDVGYDSATLNVYLSSPGAESCQVWFEYGTTDSYGNETVHFNLSKSMQIHVSIYNLELNRTYHFRAVAMNKAGIVYGEDKTFTTHVVLPSVETENATNVTSTSAELHGVITDTGGGSCQVWFEYGTTDSYGNSTPIINATSSFNITISSLLSGKTYHFRAVAMNKAGIVYGEDKTFTTHVAEPSVATSSIEYAVILHGNLADTGGGSCQVWFEYGTTDSYGNSTPKQNMSHPGIFEAVVSGLLENATYHYRAVVENENGIFYGEDMTFKTLSLPSPPSINTFTPSISGVNVTFRANLSSMGDSTSCYVWFEYWNDEFNETTPVMLVNVTGEVKYNTSLSSGSYFVRAVAVGSSGRICYGGMIEFNVTKHNNPPSISGVSPINVTTDVNVLLRVYADDIDGDILNITFYWGNGSVIGWKISNGGVVSLNVMNLSYNTSYTWYAIADDGVNESSTTLFTFTTVNEMNANVSYSPSLIIENETVNFSAVSTGANSWTWQFGDGGIAYGSNVSHVYDEAGEYNVTLTISNGILTKSYHIVIHVFMLGDVNMDGKLNALDVTKMELLHGTYFRLADMNSDGAVNEQDVSLLIHKIVG